MDFEAIIPVSALERDGIDVLIKTIDSLMEEGPKYFPDDMSTDQPERFMVAEIIREKILTLTRDEVPHGIGVEVMSFKVRPNNKLADIEVNIYCEKYTHKGILIGKQGFMLKRIGTWAREEIENLLGIKVNLQLWIKVKEDWRNKQGMLNTLGYRN
jgi:GTP-binding protein Era